MRKEGLSSREGSSLRTLFPYAVDETALFELGNIGVVKIDTDRRRLGRLRIYHVQLRHALNHRLNYALGDGRVAGEALRDVEITLAQKLGVGNAEIFANELFGHFFVGGGEFGSLHRGLD